MRKILIATLLTFFACTNVFATTISVAKFKKLDYSLLKQQQLQQLSVAEFKKLDYQLCKIDKKE